MTLTATSVCPAGGEHEDIITGDYRSEMKGTCGRGIEFRVWLKSRLGFWDTVLLGKEETRDTMTFAITLCRKCSTLFGVSE